jgi:hypothetical protein
MSEGQNRGVEELQEGGKVEDYLAALEEHRRTCEREGNYVEAEMAKNRIEEMRMTEGQRQMEDLLLK